MPDKDKDGIFRSHGTRCAGEIIMQPDNEICGVGTAYGANIGGRYLFYNHFGIGRWFRRCSSHSEQL